jgi:hypothetical protein
MPSFIGAMPFAVNASRLVGLPHRCARLSGVEQRLGAFTRLCAVKKQVFAGIWSIDGLGAPLRRLLFDLLIAAIINFIRAQSARMIAGRQPQETGVAVPRARRALI